MIVAKSSSCVSSFIFIICCFLCSKGNSYILFSLSTSRNDPFVLSLSQSQITRQSATKAIRKGIISSLFIMTSSPTSLAATTDVNDKKTIRWGIVGLGDVCQKKSGPAFYKCEGSALVAVMRRTAGKAAAFAENVPSQIVSNQSISCVGYDDLDSFLNHPEMDAVYVSTRPGTHLEICEKVAMAGKACYVEKPVGRCAEETKRIVELFEKANLPLYTAYISRAYDRTQAVRKLLKDGAIGKTLNSVSYHLIGSGGARGMDEDELPWRLDAKQSGGGLIMDVGCHILDRIDYICGPLTNVKGTADNRNSPSIAVEDYVHINALIGKGSWAAIPGSVGAQVDCTWEFVSEKDPIDELVFEGPNGKIKLEGMNPCGPVSVLDENGTVIHELSFQMPEHTAQQLIQSVVNDLRGERDVPDFISKGANAIRTQIVLDQALQEFYGGRAPGFWLK